MEQWEIDNNPFHSFHRWPDCEVETEDAEWDDEFSTPWENIIESAKQMGIAANEVTLRFQKHFNQYRHVLVDGNNNTIWVMPGHFESISDHTPWSYSPLVGFTSAEEDAKNLQTFIERYGGPLKGFVPYDKKNKKRKAKERVERKLKNMQEKDALRKKHERELQQLEAYEELKRFDKKSRRLSG